MSRRSLEHTPPRAPRLPDGPPSEPLNAQGERAFFSPEHNEWLDNLYGWPAGSALGIYQANAALREDARRLIDAANMRSPPQYDAVVTPTHGGVLAPTSPRFGTPTPPPIYTRRDAANTGRRVNSSWPNTERLPFYRPDAPRGTRMYHPMAEGAVISNGPGQAPRLQPLRALPGEMNRRRNARSNGTQIPDVVPSGWRMPTGWRAHAAAVNLEMEREAERRAAGFVEMSDFTRRDQARQTQEAEREGESPIASSVEVDDYPGPGIVPQELYDREMEHLARLRAADERGEARMRHLLDRETARWGEDQDLQQRILRNHMASNRLLRARPLRGDADVRRPQEGDADHASDSYASGGHMTYKPTTPGPFRCTNSDGPAWRPYPRRSDRPDEEADDAAHGVHVPNRGGFSPFDRSSSSAAHSPFDAYGNPRTPPSAFAGASNHNPPRGGITGNVRPRSAGQIDRNTPGAGLFGSLQPLGTYRGDSILPSGFFGNLGLNSSPSAGPRGRRVTFAENIAGPQTNNARSSPVVNTPLHSPFDPAATEPNFTSPSSSSSDGDAEMSDVEQAAMGTNANSASRGIGRPGQENSADEANGESPRTRTMRSTGLSDAPVGNVRITRNSARLRARGSSRGRARGRGRGR